MPEHRILLDVDTGIDDALMILYLAAQPGVELVAAGSVHGNVDARRAALNTLRVLEVCGRAGVPVAQGAAEPLAQPLRTAWMVHGSDGLGEIDAPPPAGTVSGEHAADQIVRLSVESPGELDLLAVGPLTNVALAVQQDPDVLTRFRRVVIMGGSGPEERTWGALAMDANVDHDPEAAEIVFSSVGDLTMVGTNLDPYLGVPAAGLARMEAATHRHSEFAWRIVQFYLDFQERSTGRRTMKLWDPLAAAVLLDESLVEGSFAGPVDLILSDKGYRAVSLTDRRAAGRLDARPDVRVVTAIDAERFVESFLAALTNPLPD